MADGCAQSGQVRPKAVSETDDSFADVQEGMGLIGAGVTLTMDGGVYSGIYGSPDLATQMLTGGYQGRSHLVIRSLKSQYSAPPPQTGAVLVTDSSGKDTQWQRKEVAIDDLAYYVLTLIRQIPQ